MTSPRQGRLSWMGNYRLPSEHYIDFDSLAKEKMVCKVVFQYTRPFNYIPLWAKENNYTLDGIIIPYFKKLHRFDDFAEELQENEIVKKIALDKKFQGDLWLGKCSLKGYKHSLEFEAISLDPFLDSYEFWIHALENNHIYEFLKELNIFVEKIDNKDKISKIFIYPEKTFPRPNLSWDSVVLPEEIKEDIKMNIESFFSSKDVFKKLNIPYKRGMLVVGKPGNGKSTLMKVIASQYRESSFFLFESNKDSTVDDLICMLKRASQMSPAIALIEDLDKVINESKVNLSSFLNAMDGLTASEGVLIIATSNEPGNIDPALIERPSRFDRVYSVSLPDYKTACALLKLRIPEFTEEFLLRLSKMCVDKKFSMAMIQEIIVHAALKSMFEKRQFTEKDLEDSFYKMSKQKNEIRGIKETGDTQSTGSIGFNP